MIIQLNPPIPVTTPSGKGLAHALIDDGIEHDLKWIVFRDKDGQCWTYRNHEIRAQANLIQGRNHISPFYDPKDVSLKNPPDDDISYMLPHHVQVILDRLLQEEIEKREDALNQLSRSIEETEKYKKKYNELNSIIKKLINDDHVFPQSRENVKLKIKQIDPDNENENENFTDIADFMERGYKTQ